MCFQSQCMNIKIIETCLEKYQIMIRKIRTEFMSEIQEFKKFKKLMKKKLLDVHKILRPKFIKIKVG